MIGHLHSLRHLVKDVLAGRPAKLRSPKWHACRKRHLAQQPECQWCGHTVKCEIHHVKSFHEYPKLELVETNLITLCEAPALQCHLRHGHQGNWKTNNPDIRAECAKQRPFK